MAADAGEAGDVLDAEDAAACPGEDGAVVASEDVDGVADLDAFEFDWGAEAAEELAAEQDGMGFVEAEGPLVVHEGGIVRDAAVGGADAEAPGARRAGDGGA